jgi:hypothetical protein
MRVRPPLQVGKTANAVEIFNEYDKTIASVTRPDAFVTESPMISPVYVLRYFLDVAF